MVFAGAITTLGRGGSDLSATVIGAALGLPEVQVWKDVDGEHQTLTDCCLITDFSVTPEVTPLMQQCTSISVVQIFVWHRRIGLVRHASPQLCRACILCKQRMCLRALIECCLSLP